MNGISTPFYLTGGTALSRGYLNHRYSDDLDFFLNSNKSFDSYYNQVLQVLREDGFEFDSTGYYSPGVYAQQTIFSKTNPNLKMKIDFVNDVESYFGEINYSNKNLLFPIDNLYNILTNKLSALVGRTEGKDVVDLWALCKNFDFSWENAVNDVLKKEVSFDTRFVSEILVTFPENEFDKINWVKKPDFNVFSKDIKIIIEDMYSEKNNSLRNFQNL